MAQNGDSKKTRQKRGRKPLSDEQRREREEQIIQLQKAGRSTYEIAKTMRLTESYICRLTRHLAFFGRTKPLNRGSKQISWRDLENPQVQTIITLQKQRATLE